MTATIVQSVFGSGGAGGLTLSLGSAVTAGNILVVFTERRNGGIGGAPSSASVNNTSGRAFSFNSFASQVGIRAGDLAGGDSLFAGWVVAVGDEATVNWNFANIHVAFYEIGGIDDPDNMVAEVLTVSQSTASTKTIGTFANTSPNHIYLMAQIIDTSGSAHSPGTGIIEDYEAANFSGHPYCYFAHASTSASLPITAQSTGSSFEWGGIAVDLIGNTLDCNPRIIDDFNRIVNIRSDTDSFDRSNYGPVWDADNTILSAPRATIFQDNLNRSVGTGLGTSSDGTTNYTTFPSSTGIDVGSVNGTFYEMPLNGAWWWTGYPELAIDTLYTAQFDFLTPDDTTDFDLVEFDQIVSGGANWLTFFVNGNANTTATVTAAGGSGVVTGTDTIAASTWYTAKMEFTLNASTAKPVKVKFWERATAEPAWMGTGTLTATTVTPYPPTEFFPSLYVGNGLSTTSSTGIDNLKIVEGSLSGATSIYSVDGSSVYFDIDLFGNPNSSHLETLTLPFELWMVNNQEYSIRFKTDQIPDGSTISKYYDIIFSVSGPTAGPMEAKARVSLSATYGKVYLGSSNVVKTDWAANEWYTILIKRTNADASVFIWADSESHPSSPQVVLTADYSWPFDTDALFTVSFDWTEISDGAFVSAFDNFNRTASNLGTASPSGATWAWTTGTGYAVTTTDGSSAIVPFTATDRLAYSYIDSPVVPSLKEDSFVFEVRFRQTTLVSSGSDGIGWQWYGPSYAERIRIDINTGSTGATGVSLSLNGSESLSGISGPTITANDWFILKFDFKSGSHGRIKLWKESSGEPGTWLINLTDPGTNLSDIILWDWYNELQNGQTLTREYDYLNLYNGRLGIRLDDLIAGCIETAITPPTPSAGFGVYTRDSMLLSIRASFTDDNLYNHSIVIGTGNKSQIIVSEIKDTDSLSPTRIAAIGDRVFRYESDQISTQDAADKAAIKNYLANCLISEDIDLEAICNPAFEGNDVIAVQELTFSELDQKFRLRAFTVPLSTSRQTFKLSRVISI